jgi:RNA polymerase sigma factor (sigma-70 family)
MLQITPKLIWKEPVAYNFAKSTSQAGALHLKSEKQSGRTYSIEQIAHTAAYIIHHYKVPFSDRKQQAVLALLINRQKIREADYPSNLARTIAERAILKLFRDEECLHEIAFSKYQERGEPQSEEDAAPLEIGEVFGTTSNPGERPASPDAVSEMAAQNNAERLDSVDVDRLLLTLAETERRIIYMYFGFFEFGELTLKEIAGSLGMPLATVHWVKHEALKKLRGLLGVE